MVDFGGAPWQGLASSPGHLSESYVTGTQEGTKPKNVKNSLLSQAPMHQTVDEKAMAGYLIDLSDGEGTDQEKSEDELGDDVDQLMHHAHSSSVTRRKVVVLVCLRGTCFESQKYATFRGDLLG